MFRAQEMDILTKSGVSNITPTPVKRRFNNPVNKTAMDVVTQTNTPQFPGSRNGDQIEKVRNFIKQQKRVKGFQFDIVNGSQNERQIQLSGMAKMFLGFSLVLSSTNPAAYPTSFTFTINNEIIIEGVAPVLFSPDFMDDEYYFFPRPLNGSDNITVNFNGQSAMTVYGAFYYL